MTKKNQLTTSLPREWYYSIGAAPVGPFSYLEMIRLIQTKNIPENIFVWKKGMAEWAPLNRIEVFKADEVSRLLNSGIPGVVNYFSHREFIRIPYSAKFILHNEELLWKGVSFELGAGGIGLMVSSDQFQLGQELYIHKISRGGVVSINAAAEVVSKLTNGMRPGQARYGFEFSDISKEDQEKILAFTETYSNTKKIAS